MGSGPVAPGASSAAFQPISATQAIAMMSVTGSDGDVFLTLTGSATAPSAAQIIAGQTHTGSAVPAGHTVQSPVAASGLQVLAPGVSGLAPGTTYHGYAVYRNGGGAPSAVQTLGSITTPSSAGTGSVSVSVIKRSTSQVAPEAIWFRASVTVAGIADVTNLTQINPAWTDVQYVWDFGDPGARSNKVDNLPAAHNDLNKAHGKEVAHVFEGPGSYTISCTAYNRLTGALIGRDTTTITTLDANAEASGTRTIVVDPGNTGLAGSYPGCRTAATFIAAMTDLRNESGFNRIVLADGLDQTIGTRFNVRNNFPSVQIIRGGGGTRPTLRFQQDNIRESAIRIDDGYTDDFSLVGIQARGVWNTLNETGNRSNFIEPRQESNFYCLTSDCDFANFGNCAVFVESTRNDLGENPCAIAVHNTRIYGWGNYGVYVDPQPGSFLAIVGCFIKQNFGALNGGEGRPGGARPHATNMHGPIRIGAFQTLYIAVCDTFSRNGWSEENADVPSEQPNLRIAYQPNSHVNRLPKYVIERCAMEGGRSVLSLGASTGSPNYYGVNGLVEKCLLVGTCNTLAFFSVQFGGTFVRNCIAVRPEVKSCSNSRWVGVFEEPWGNGNKNQNPSFPLRFYGLSILNNMNDTQRTSPNGQVRALGMESDLQGTIPNYEIENFINWCPNASGQGTANPQIESDRMLTVGGVHTARYEGRQYINNSFGGQKPALDTSYASPENEVLTARPGGGSPVLDAVGNEDAALDDFYGFPRGANPDRGAVERIYD
jgi:hypothetical protein